MSQAQRHCGAGYRSEAMLGMGLREISGKAGLVMQRRRSPAKPDDLADVIPLLRELKRAFTLDEIELCREAVKSREEWMRVCFEIGLFTGCRLRETRIPLTCIDLEAAVPTIPFPTPKDGQRKAFSIPIPSALFPLFREMKKERRRTHTIASFPFQPSRCWQIFFPKRGDQGRELPLFEVDPENRTSG